MATLVLQVAGSLLGDFLGGPIGAVIGQTIGAVAGSAIDRQIFGRTAGRSVQGPRLGSVAGLASSEGTPIPRVYGRVRIGARIRAVPGRMATRSPSPETRSTPRSLDSHDAPATARISPPETCQSATSRTT